MGNWWWAWFAVAVGLNLGAAAWNVLAARRHLRAVTAQGAGKPPAEVAVGDQATKNGGGEWLWGAWEEARKRDQAVLDDLRARTEAITKEGAAAVLREARSQLAKEIEPLLLTIQKRAQSLQCLHTDSGGVQELLEDVRLLSEAIDRTP